MKKQVISGRVLSARTAKPLSVVAKGEKSIKTVNEQGQSVIIVQGQSGEVTINLTEISKHLQILLSKAHTFIRDLSSEDRQCYEHITAVRNHLVGTGAISHLDEVIAEVFKDVKTVMPGTVAAYFVGCFRDSNFTGIPGCSAHCAGSLSPEEGTMGWTPCHHTCFLYDNSTFNVLNDNADRSHGHIFMNEKTASAFTGFTSEEINKLKIHGVIKAKLYSYKDGANYTDITKDFVSLENLPRKSEDVKRSLEIPSKRSEDKKRVISDDPSSNSVSILLLVAIVLILLGAVWYSSKNKRSMMTI